MGNLRAFSTDRDEGPGKDIHFMVNPSGEEFHVHNEEIGGDGITLPNSLGGNEEGSFVPIYEDKDRGSRDVRHDKIDQFGRNIEEVEGLSN